MVPKKRKFCFSNNNLSLDKWWRWVMKWTGMFSFTEENDPQIGREKQNILNEKGKANALNIKLKYWISVAEEHFFLI